MTHHSLDTKSPCAAALDPHRACRRLAGRPTRAAAAPFALSAIALLVLSACGGDHTDEDKPTAVAPQATVAISGVVADGPLSAATVCYDLNDNDTCDAGEPSSQPTEADGRYSLNVAVGDAGKHALLALVPASAVDRDSGAAIGAALTLKAPASANPAAHAVFISPLSTAVADLARDHGKSVAEAAQQVQESLRLTNSPLLSFVGTDAPAALAAKALTAVMVQATQLASAAGVAPAQAGELARVVASNGLSAVATALADNGSASTAVRVAQAVSAAHGGFNLSASTAKAVAEAVGMPAGAPDVPGTFISPRRFTYTDANTYSYTLFVGDSSKTAPSGEYAVSEVRKTQTSTQDLPFNRNQLYWTGTDWFNCPQQWEVGRNKAIANGKSSSGIYCNASRSETVSSQEDIAGKSLRDIVTRMRAYPLSDSVGAHTNNDGLPVNWGPNPALLPAASTFPAGSKLVIRRQRADIGHVDRLELTTKSTVLWPDGRYRQATRLAQFDSMKGNLADANALVGNANTVYVFDLPLDTQSDSTLETFKRYRAGFDMTKSTARFYKCNVRKSDQASLSCEPAGDATLALAQLGSTPVLRFASGYPAELTQQLKVQRFWAEHAGVVFRGARDLERVRHEQRLNTVAWNALRSALAIPEHSAPLQPVASGPAQTLRSFTFSDADNYSWRSFAADTRAVDANGYYRASETRANKNAGTLVPYTRNQLMWTGSDWYSCPSDGIDIIVVGTQAPFDSVYCKTYLDERAVSVTLTLDGRRMADVVSDIRAYGSKDASFDYGGWGANPAVHTVLNTATFPVGSTMEYRGNQRKATPVVIGIAANDRVRVPPAANTTAAFATWPYAASLEEFIAKYPGDWQGAALNGNLAFYVHGLTLPSAPSPAYTTTLEYRVAFDANGQKARFYTNNRNLSNNGTTNYVRLLDTTYSIEAIGGLRVLKFAALPPEFDRDFYFERRFAEREAAVWYAFKDAVPATPIYSIRLNGAAAEALGKALGIR